MTNPPRSLFRMASGSPELRPGDPIQQLMELFSRRTPLVMLRDHLEVIEAAASEAESNPDIERGREHAEMIRVHVRELRAALAKNDAAHVGAAAIKLTERWMMLRYDVHFAAAVREKENRLDSAAKKVTDGEIETAWREVVKRYPNADEVQQIKFVAGHLLDITEKQVRDRLHRMKLNGLKP